jgi:hypothetical protein
MVVELLFDGGYLFTLWLLVFGLGQRLGRLEAPSQRCARPLVAAFALLALGDTAHVGLRLLGLVGGGLQDGWIGYGALATAITVTLFDLLLVQGHQRLRQRRWGPLPRVLVALALLRLVLLSLPQNRWAAAVPPQPWSLLRNLPLVALTAGVAWLYLRTPGPCQRWQRAIGGLLLASALCHLPVALWIQRQPLLGLLMIPKSLAYLGVGLIVYRRLPSIAPITSR